MYRLLIVDDEKQIREGLKRIVNWEDYGISACLEASDGQEALSLIEMEKPEIVITDIRMPKMDGIELLYRLHQLDVPSRAIVLSGYDDYELVRRAMKYGAVDYLLKPVAGSDLIKIIDEVTESIEKNDQAGEGADSWLLQRSFAMQRLMSGAITPTEFKNRMQVLGHEVKAGPCAVGLVLSTKDKEDDHESEAMALLTKVSSAFADDKRFICFLDDEYRLCIFFWEADENLIRGKHPLPAEILGFIREQGDDRFLFMIGSLSRSFRSAGQSYENALAACDFTGAFPDESILTFENIVDAGDPEKTRAMDIDEEAFLERIRALDPEGAMKRVQECRASFGSCVDYQTLQAFKNGIAEYTVLTCQGLKGFSAVDRREAVGKKERTINRIYHVADEEDALSYLEGYIREMIGKAQGETDAQYGRLVTAMLELANETYDNVNMSLQHLAVELKGNAAYLGRVFKKETGWSFNDYLSHIRIEKAQKLLRETNMKGTEICEKTGFTNYNYFYLTFKKQTGMTPMDYRAGSL
ncbi:MAG: response regulator [Lachnospiraceae bacterium]|nr:response regulator [Lachnospiraceae bacterium]